MAVGLLTTVGCGRTDLGDFETFEEVAHDVEAAREVVLEDERVVYVELISPAPSRARSDLMGLSNGVSLDELIASVCPEGAPTVELDATSGTMMVYEYGGLRAIITL